MKTFTYVCPEGLPAQALKTPRPSYVFTLYCLHTSVFLCVRV